jgi:hypothetical protein
MRATGRCDPLALSGRLPVDGLSPFLEPIDRQQAERQHFSGAEKQRL